MSRVSYLRTCKILFLAKKKKTCEILLKYLLHTCPYLIDFIFLYVLKIKLLNYILVFVLFKILYGYLKDGHGLYV